MKNIKWDRNIGSAIACGIMPIIIAPARWYIGIAVMVGWFFFGCLVDLAIAKLLAKRKPRRVNRIKCNICQHHESAICFYSVWYPGCGGPEPELNPQLKCPKCGSNDVEEVNG